MGGMAYDQAFFFLIKVSEFILKSYVCHLVAVRLDAPKINANFEGKFGTPGTHVKFNDRIWLRERNFLLLRHLPCQDRIILGW